MTVSGIEFLRRFGQHILPRGFVRIRQFGFLTNCRRPEFLALARRLLSADAGTAAVVVPSIPAFPTWRCPQCSGEMRMGPNLSAWQLAALCRSLDSS